MPKISRFGGATNAGFTDRDSGFTDDTTATRATASELSEPDGDDAPETPADGPEESAPDTEPESETVLPFDPGDYSVNEVNGALPGLSDVERSAVLDAERAGLKRKGIIGRDE